MATSHTVRFARTVDGLAIPYTVSGAGFPFVQMPMAYPATDSRMFEWLDGLDQRFRRITFEGRGVGLGPRGIRSFHVEDILADLTAVIEAADADRCLLFARLRYGPAAIQYAADHPERVAALLLVDSFPPHGLFAWQAGLAALAKDNWYLLRRTLCTSNFQVTTDEQLESDIEMLGQRWTQEDFLVMLRDGATADVRPSLSAVRVPTLVMTIPRDLEIAEHCIAAAIPGAELSVRPDNSGCPISDTGLLLATIDDFLRRRVPEASANECSGMNESGNGIGVLTEREQGVLRLLAGGRSNAEIADELVVSQRTVARHIVNVYSKIDVHNRAQATAYALTHALAP